MKITYVLKPFKKNPFLDKIDLLKRRKVEEVTGKTMTEYEWLMYKQMTLPKNKN